MLELLATPFMANLGKGLGQGIGDAMGAAPAGPSHAAATGTVYGSGLDSSAWSVNFSGTQSTSSNQDKSGGVPGFGLSGASSVPGYVWLGVAGLVAWKLFSRL